jgi:pimeloyl-ACP methyl ester carboxylesterase
LKTVTSKDGTTIAFDRSGTGPTVILVDGAMMYRAIGQGMSQLADRLSQHFTVLHHDRRGRGDSTETQPYAIAREIEDIEALIDEARGPAFLYGISSGGILAMEAAIELGDKVKKLAMYEVPVSYDENIQQGWKNYRKNLNEAVAAGRAGDAVELFMQTVVGMPAEQVAGMRQSPMWPMLESAGLTLAYDAELLGPESSVPVKRAGKLTVPTLVMVGGSSFPFMLESGKQLADAIPNGTYSILEGQTHDPSPDALAPVLIEFFK